MRQKLLNKLLTIPYGWWTIPNGTGLTKIRMRVKPYLLIRGCSGPRSSASSTSSMRGEMQTPPPLTTEQALANASRLLEAAEGETDRTLMEMLTRIAEGWTAVAAQLLEQNR